MNIFDKLDIKKFSADDTGIWYGNELVAAWVPGLTATRKDMYRVFMDSLPAQAEIEAIDDPWQAS